MIFPTNYDQLKKIVYYSNKFGVSIIFNSAKNISDYEKPLDKPFLCINLKNLNHIEFVNQKTGKNEISIKCGATLSEVKNFCAKNEIWVPECDPLDSEEQFFNLITKNGFSRNSLSRFVTNTEVLLANGLTMNSRFGDGGDLNSGFFGEMENVSA